MPPVGIALVGAGPWGRTLGRAFSATTGAELRWICELNPERRAQAHDAHPEVRVAADLEQALADPAVTAVAVATEPMGHHRVGLRVLEANRHLYVEKPMALSTGEAAALHAAARSRKRVLAVGHLLLHHPAVLRARQVIASGALGDPLRFESTRETVGAPRTPDSAWWALAPHDVSMAIDLFGAVPATVSATGAAFAAPDQDGIASAIFRFSDGRIAHIRVARFATAKTRRMSIVGSLRTLTFDELAAGHPLVVREQGSPAAEPIPLDVVDVLAAQCRQFVSSVEQDDPAGGNGAHAVSVVRVLEAGARSMREGGAPVEPA